MFKNIEKFALCFVLLLIIGTANNYVKAADYYVGQYKNGNSAYLMTEPISKWENVFIGGYNVGGYDCNVKEMSPAGDLVGYVNYHVWLEPSFMFIKNGKNIGQSGIGEV